MIRLDLALKHSRLIKRRTVAKLYCERGLVKINDRVGKPSSDVKDGDEIEVKLGNKTVRFVIHIEQQGNKIILSYDLINEGNPADA